MRLKWPNRFHAIDGSLIIAVERAQETGTGILVYSLISALLWLRTSRDALEDASRRLFAIQGQLYRAYRGLMRGEGRPEDSPAIALIAEKNLLHAEESKAPPTRS